MTEELRWNCKPTLATFIALAVSEDANCSDLKMNLEHKTPEMSNFVKLSSKPYQNESAGFWNRGYASTGPHSIRNC